MDGFKYPSEPHQRRHGPVGYSDYPSYRDWLRDEFFFCCVYCLHREQWYDRAGTFDVDHFVPTSVDPNRLTEYENLLYACRSCNGTKGKYVVPNPCEIAFGDC